MRKIETWVGAALWVAVAVLMPMSALEPVSTGAAADAAQTAPLAIGFCADGSARLAMGCASIHL